MLISTRRTRLRDVSRYYLAVVLMFVPKIPGISTENLPQGMTPFLLTTGVTEILRQRMTPIIRNDR